MLGHMLLGPFETRRASLFDSDRALVVPPPGVPASYAISTAHPLPPALRRLLPADGTPIAWDPSGGVAVRLYRVPERAAPALERPLVGGVGGVAEFRGYTLPREARPGDTIVAVVSFEARRADPRDLVWRAHLLLDPSTGRWVGEDFRGFPAEAWRPGETVYLAFQLHVPVDVGPGAHPVELAVYDAVSTNHLRIGDTDHVDLGPVWIEARDASAAPGDLRPLGVRFGGGLLLTGYQIRGGRLTLAWHVETAPPRDYTTFVHVLDANGAVVAQADGMPTRPTSTWEAGDGVVDQRPISLPPAARTVRVGLYELDTGKRLPTDQSADFVDLPIPPEDP